MALIELPKIGNIEGAVYDTVKPQREQSEECVHWAHLVSQTISRNEELSEYEGVRRKRIVKSVYDYEGVRLTVLTKYAYSISSSAYSALAEPPLATIKLI